MKMQISPLIEEMKFYFLRDFVNWIDECIAREWGSIEKKRQTGEFAEYANYESAMDYPLFRAEYAAHAVLHLLNALVDEQLRNIVEASTEFTYDHTKPALPSEKVGRLSFGKIIKHIDNTLSISLTDIEGWNHYLQVREMVNALKHTAGKRHLGEVLNEGGSWDDLKYKPMLEDVKESVNVCRKLVSTLFEILRKHETSA